MNAPDGNVFGREAEQAAIRRTLTAARHGVAAVLVLSGDVGIGKTALLEDAIANAEDACVLRVTGFESEARWSYSGLQQLIAQLSDDLPALSAPERSAIERAVGTADGDASDARQLGASVSALLACRWARSPVLLVIDDEHWLDPDSRRLLELLTGQLNVEPVAVLAATALRERSAFASAPVLAVGPLDRTAAERVLSTSASGPLAPQVAARIVALIGGNPAGLIDAARRLSGEERSGTAGLPDPFPPGPHLAAQLERWFEALTADARTIAVVAALEATGSPERVWSATARLGIDIGFPGFRLLSERIGLTEIVDFSPPILRSAVLLAASPDQRHDAHGALAGAFEAVGDDAFAAWHRAALALAPDESLAAGLEAAADAIRHRLGESAALRVRLRVAELSMAGPNYSRRLSAAVAALIAVGQLTDASILLERDSRASSAHANDSDTLILRGLLQHEAGVRTASQTLLMAAQTTRGARASSRYTLLRRALAAVLDFGDADRGETRGKILAQLAGGPDVPTSGFNRSEGASLKSQQQEQPNAKPAGHEAPCRPSGATLHAAEDPLSELTLAWAQAIHVLDARALSGAERELTLVAERHHAPARRVAALARVVISRVLVGNLSSAVSLMDDLTADGLTDDRLGASLLPAQALVLSWKEGAAATRESVGQLPEDDARRPEIRALSCPSLLIGELADGQFVAAAGIAADTHLREGYPSPSWASADVVEALVRTDRVDEARPISERFAQMARGWKSDWALGLASRCEGLVVQDAQQVDLAFRASIDHLSKGGIVLELARSRLIYGEWLRRERKRRDARDQLRSAYNAFIDAGAAGFARRADRELGATAEHVNSRPIEDRDRLTPREHQVAQLAAGGATTRSIAETLFLTPATVAGHLSSVYTKLGVTRRTALQRALSQLDKPDP